MAKAKNISEKLSAKDKARIDELFLKALGNRINGLILKKYNSIYQFWVERSENLISRAGLNYILHGQREPKITTLRLIAEALDMTLDDLLDFDDPAPPYTEG